MHLNIVIVVHGRFYAFHLARELIRRGHEVMLFTNYPKRIVAKFGLTNRTTPQFCRTSERHHAALVEEQGFLNPDLRQALIRIKGREKGSVTDEIHSDVTPTPFTQRMLRLL